MTNTIAGKYVYLMFMEGGSESFFKVFATKKDAMTGAENECKYTLTYTPKSTIVKSEIVKNEEKGIVELVVENTYGHTLRTTYKIKKMMVR